jgi:hypothetical protein
MFALGPPENPDQLLEELGKREMAAPRRVWGACPETVPKLDFELLMSSK